MPRSFEPRQFQCIKRAEDARRRAHSASGVRERAELLQVEQRWLGLAESYALSDRISLSIADTASARQHGARMAAAR
jgi:hypothetical protein